MPKCWKCHAPVTFVPVLNGYEINPSAKPIPVDVNPDNENGTIALVDFPLGFGRHCELPAGTTSTKVARRIYGEARAKVLRLGGTLFRCHFDSCRNR